MITPIYDWKSTDAATRARLLRRSEEDISQVAGAVAEILAAVKAEGDAALCRYTARFDHPGSTPDTLWVTEAEFEAAAAKVDPKVRAALEYAVENVRRFHACQVPAATPLVEVRPGLIAGERHVPLDRVALYVPRGRGSFPSMLYMLAVPAVLAGVGDIIVCTPPDRDGSVDPACLYAARLCGVKRVLRAGGAQAVAALAYGTAAVPKVDKIVGPGSAYVTAAKRLVSGIVDIGLPAGPSESVVIADGAADPRRLAFDLLVEAEHGADSAALLLTWSKPLAAAVQAELESIIPTVPGQRQEFIRAVMANYGGIVVLDSEEAACALSNEIAPEHLMVQTASPWDTLARITHAGEVLLGPDTPFSAANYLTGPNAVLPTGGKARTWSAVSVRDFLHTSSIVQASPAALAAMAGHVVALADYEGFHCHARTVRERFPGTY